MRPCGSPSSAAPLPGPTRAAPSRATSSRRTDAGCCSTAARACSHDCASTSGGRGSTRSRSRTSISTIGATWFPGRTAIRCGLSRARRDAGALASPGRRAEAVRALVMSARDAVVETFSPREYGDGPVPGGRLRADTRAAAALRPRGASASGSRARGDDRLQLRCRADVRTGSARPGRRPVPLRGDACRTRERPPGAPDRRRRGGGLPRVGARGGCWSCTGRTSCRSPTGSSVPTTATRRTSDPAGGRRARRAGGDLDRRMIAAVRPFVSHPLRVLRIDERLVDGEERDRASVAISALRTTISPAARPSALFHGSTSARAHRESEPPAALDHAPESGRGVLGGAALDDVVDAALDDEHARPGHRGVEAGRDLVGALPVDAVIAEVEPRVRGGRPTSAAGSARRGSRSARRLPGRDPRAATRP